ncbi:hypothetical protein RCL1_005997 [Eukaryota sp. TZLM3-RCL]
MTSPSPTTIWADGVYDCFHVGHANALRQASKLGDRLVAGVHSSEVVAAQKGAPTIQTLAERAAILAACKWVDGVGEDAPWNTDLAFCEEKCGPNFYVAHGDDLCLSADGSDPYEVIKSAGKMKIFERTKGVSTTDLVTRLLAHESSQSNLIEEQSPYTGGNSFILTASLITSFYEFCRTRKQSDSVAYIHGAFDILHPGHLEVIKHASRHFDHVIVGIWSDSDVANHRCDPYPILSMQERALMVLSLRGVDDVIIGAPCEVDDKFIKTQGITKVITGPCAYNNSFNPNLNISAEFLDVVNSNVPEMSYKVLAERVLSRKDVYLERNRKKNAKELASLKAASQISA